jgi:hypothetical protein
MSTPCFPLFFGVGASSKSTTPPAAFLWAKAGEEVATPPRRAAEARMHTAAWRFRNMEPLFD